MTPVAGAVAYAWYLGVAGSEVLQAITTVPTITFSAPLTTGTQAATAITADNSRNPNYAFDGLLTTAFNPANSAYVKNLLGAFLTASGRGSVNEVDAMLYTMWQTYKLSPTVIYANAQDLQNLTNRVLSAGTQGGAVAPLLRQNVAMGPDGKITAGNVLAWYFNPFALGAGQMIPVRIHPTLPPGTLICWCEDLPAQYQSNDVPNVAEMHVRRDWYDINWPLVTRSYQNGLYVEETLAVYAPFAMGILTGIGNG